MNRIIPCSWDRMLRGTVFPVAKQCIGVCFEINTAIIAGRQPVCLEMSCAFLLPWVGLCSLVFCTTVFCCGGRKPFFVILQKSDGVCRDVCFVGMHLVLDHLWWEPYWDTRNLQRHCVTWSLFCLFFSPQQLFSASALGNQFVFFSCLDTS